MLTKSIVKMIRIAALVFITSGAAFAQYNQSTDLISLHYDHAPDRDDGHATVAGRAVTDFFGIIPLVVGGAYGVNASSYNSDSEAVMDATWGNAWIDAHNSRDSALSEATQAWTEVLQSGGDIYVAEGGQSDFTADVVRNIQSSITFDTEDRIHVIQHSSYNEDNTTPADLDYTRANTDYIKIPNGNNTNATANFNQRSSDFVTAARNSKFGDAWDAAFDYLDPINAKLDFSDTVELMEILDIGTNQVDGPDDFADMFFSVQGNSDTLTSIPNETGPSTPQIWSDSYSVNGQCHCDSTFDHGLRGITSMMPDGTLRSVPEICEAIDDKYGDGAQDGRVYYNTVQCGHEPTNTAADEAVCPGIPIAAGNYTGPQCNQTGATWNLDKLFPAVEDSTTGTDTPVISTPVTTETETSTPVISTPVTPITEVSTPIETNDTVNSSSFVAVKVEAEALVNSDSGWTLVTPTSAEILPDPDPKHLANASGNYLELLPDTRVTHNDALLSGTNFWDTSGDGPSIDYNIEFPESGTYIVWVKAYSTGTEDNGIHVGINGSTPDSGARIQWCGGKNEWTWSSAQRVDSNHCGVPRTISINVPSAGTHSIEFYAREDGFEFDQAIFLKETHDGSLTCSPTNEDEISCVRNSNGEVVVTAEVDDSSDGVSVPVVDDVASEPSTSEDGDIVSNEDAEPIETSDSETGVVSEDIFGPGVVSTSTTITGVFTLGDENGCDHVVSPGVDLNAVFAQRQGVVCLNSGTYQSDETIIIDSNTTMRAADIGNPPMINSTSNMAIAALTVSNVEIDSVGVVGTSVGEFMVLIGQDSNNVTMTNLNIQNSDAIGLGVFNSTEVNIDDADITGPGTGVWVSTGSSDVSVNRAEIAGTDAGGVHCEEGADDLVISDSILTNAGESAVIVDNCSNVDIDNVLVNGSPGHGIDIRNGSSGVSVSDTMILDAEFAAVRIHEGENICDSEPCVATPSEVVVDNSIFLFNNVNAPNSNCSNIRISEFVDLVSQTADVIGDMDWLLVTDSNLFSLSSDPVCVN